MLEECEVCGDVDAITPIDWDWIFAMRARELLGGEASDPAVQQFVSLKIEILQLEQNFREPIIGWIEDHQDIFDYFLPDRTRCNANAQQRPQPEQSLDDLFKLLERLICCGLDYVKLQDAEDARTQRVKARHPVYPRDAIGRGMG